ncbi:hypothetical protein HID58_034054, partial [Brassica napus]
RETQTSTDETPPKTNQEEGKPDDEEDTHAVHHTPSSPLSSLIALVIEENKNALSETETATQYFSTSEGEHTQSSRKNQAEEYLKDTTEPTTELVSTDVSKTQPLTPQTQHLQTSEGDQSDETPSEQNQAEENLKDTTEPTTELVSTY